MIKRVFSRSLKSVCYLAMILVASLAGPAQAQDTSPTKIRLVTQAFPPLQYIENGKTAGYVPEMLKLAYANKAEALGIDLGAIEFLPWKRAMQIAKTQPNVLFFSLSRTASRESSFNWLGEVSPYGQNFYKLRTSPIAKRTSIHDLKDTTYRIGVQSGSSLYTLLDRIGIVEQGNIVTYTDYHQGVKMLYSGRLDLIPLTSFLAKNSACRMGYDGNQLEAVLPIRELAKPLWLVASLGTDDDLVKALREALRTTKENGTYLNLVSSHLEKWQNRPCNG